MASPFPAARIIYRGNTRARARARRPLHAMHGGDVARFQDASPAYACSWRVLTLPPLSTRSALQPLCSTRVVATFHFFFFFFLREREPKFAAEGACHRKHGGRVPGR